MNKIMKRFTAGTLLCTLLAYTSPVLAYTKDETVYSKINGNGNRTKTIVTDHLSGEEELVNDLTDLLNIKNVSGDEEFSKDGNKITWKTNGNDVYYQGETEKELPVECNIKYELDGNEMSISSEEQAEIIRWLVRKENHYLSFEEDGFENIYYNCTISLEKKQVGGSTIGFTATVLCDAPFGYSEERTAIVNSEINKIFDTSQEIGYLIPNTVATVINDGTIEIYNDNTNETTKVLNCKAGEKIRFTDMMRISSNYPTHKTLYDDFNWVFPKIQNSFTDNVNTFTLTNCTLRLSWREIRKAVV